MRLTVLLGLLLLLVGCVAQESLPIAPPAPLPDTRQLLEEDREAPSFNRIHERYVEPHWM
jgi:hypothetical protein